MAGFGRPGGSGAPAFFASALGVERFKNLGSVFHSVPAWRRENSRALPSFGGVGREDALFSAMVAELCLGGLAGFPLVLGVVDRAVGGQVVGARCGDAQHVVHR